MQSNADGTQPIGVPHDGSPLPRPIVICIAADAKARLDDLGLTRVLEGRGHQVRTVAPKPSKALDLVQADALVLAPGSADDGTVVTVSRLRAVGLKTGIAVLCDCGTDGQTKRLLEAGADLLLGSPESPEQAAAKLDALVRRVRGDWTGRFYDIGLDARVDVTARSIDVGHACAVLGPTHFRLFLYFVEHFGRWSSESRIIRDVFGTHHAPGSSIVRTHIWSLRKALEPVGLRIEQRRQTGYRLGNIAGRP
jgi:DNA-binding response OmpR family regulator